MAIFGRKKETEYDEEEEVLEKFPVKDLKPENKKRRTEPPKPWGKKERLIVLSFLLGTVLVSGALAAGSRNWKLPNLPRLSVPSLPRINLNFFQGETITIGGKRLDPRLEEAKEKTLEEFQDKTRSLSGTYAFYVVDLNKDYPFGENEEEVLTAASLIKLPLIAFIYDQAEKGKINLNEVPKGANLTYRDLAQEMGKKSNNQAQIVAVKALGEDNLSLFIQNIGMGKTSYSTNTTTAADIGLFFQKLWNKEIVSEKSRDEILNYLTNTIYEDWIKKGIPEARVAHKYGREVHVVSDAGIVFANEPFILVVMSEGIIDKEADVFIPEIAAFIFRELK